MAGGVRVPLSVDVGDLYRDLDSVETGLGKLLREALRSAADIAARRTREKWPRGPGPQSPRDNLPHMADTIVAVGLQSTAAVVSDHPGVPVVNWGGTIAPRGVDIHFPRKEYAQQAFDETAPQIERQLQDDVDALAARYLN